MVFENRELRGIFGRKIDGVTGEWRKLHDQELNDLTGFSWLRICTGGDCLRMR
jgi:hypothetical protein